MTSSSEPVFHLRTWPRDGEEVFAVHPVPAALHEHHRLLKEDLNLQEFRRLIAEYASGERRIPESVQERVREIDALQRERGYDGP